MKISLLLDYARLLVRSLAIVIFAGLMMVGALTNANAASLKYSYVNQLQPAVINNFPSLFVNSSDNVFFDLSGATLSSIDVTYQIVGTPYLRITNNTTNTIDNNQSFISGTRAFIDSSSIYTTVICNGRCTVGSLGAATGAPFELSNETYAGYFLPVTLQPGDTYNLPITFPSAIGTTFTRSYFTAAELPTFLEYQAGIYSGHIGGLGIGKHATIYTNTGVSFNPTSRGGMSYFLPSDLVCADCFLNTSLTLNYIPAPVPVPASVWLFGSGLLGLVGMARRKKAAQPLKQYQQKRRPSGCHFTLH